MPTPPSSPSPPRVLIPDRERLLWPDLAKGACILLVVLHHVIVKDYTFLVGDRLDVIEDAWRGLTFALKPVRMPLFFAVSGFFAASSVSRSWRSSRRRIVSGYYLYVVWLAVYIGVYALETDIPANRVVSVADLFGELLWAASSLWFLYALAVYFVIAKALRRLPPAAVLGGAAALAISVSGLGIEENNRFSVLVHLVYFLAGAYYPQVLRSIAAFRPSRPALGGLVAFYGAATVVVFHSALPWSLTAFGASLIGIPLGIMLAVRCAETRVGDGLAWVGQRTLQVYVLHLVVLVVLVQVPRSLPDTGSLGVVAAIGYPVAMSAVVVAASFALHHVLVRVGLGWLFALPYALDQRLAAASAPSAPKESRESTGQPAAAAGRGTSVGKVPSEARSGSTE